MVVVFTRVHAGHAEEGVLAGEADCCDLLLGVGGAGG